MLVDLIFVVFPQVRQSSSDTSVEDLQSALDDSVNQLEQEGQLSTEALGQIFTSVSEVLNAETDEGQKDARSKVIKNRNELRLKNVTGLFHSGLSPCSFLHPSLSAERADADQNEHVSPRLSNQHESGRADDGQSRGRTHTTLR